MSLKELTWEKHQNAERTEFSQKLISGKITIDEYANYLHQMSRVYSTLETIARKLGLTNNLKGIDRHIAIEEDLIELVGPDHGLEYVPSTLRYCAHLKTLEINPNSKKNILSHLYVRHMGDLYGGQIIAKRVPGSGKFYQFENKEELIQNIRSMLSDDLSDEANVAFDYSIDILRELKNV